ncbi:MAG: hypothetical protein R3F31_26885 [Verrucomicrobiales bacterium]
MPHYLSRVRGDASRDPCLVRERCANVAPRGRSSAGRSASLPAHPPEASGVTHANPIDITHPLKRVYHSSSASGGVAIGDFDLDGEVDFFAACGPLENVPT